MKYQTSLMAVLAIGLGVGTIFAQDEGGPPPQGGGKGIAGDVVIVRRLRRLWKH
jgi:hypothetical protein